MARVEVSQVAAGKGSAGLWRLARLRKHSDFEQVYRQGRRIFSTHMTFFFLRRDPGLTPQQTKTGFAGDAPPARFGFTVPRILGAAVERNRIRRRLREAVRLNMGAPGSAVDIVIHPKKSALTAEFAELREEVEHAFQRIRSAAIGFAPSARDVGS